MDFLNVSADTVVEKEVDRVGGFKVHNADVYSAVIKAAYLDKSASGANNVVILLDDGKDFKFTSTEYITSRAGTNTYTCKRTGAKKLLPGMQKMNSLAKLLTNKDLASSVLEQRVHKIRSTGSQEATPQSRHTLVEWTGKQVHVGMLKILENKNTKVGDTYVPTAETRESNEVDKWFDADKRTLPELEVDSEAKFFETWLVANKDKVRDKTDKKLATAGAPQAGLSPTAAAQAAGAGADLSFD